MKNYDSVTDYESDVPIWEAGKFREDGVRSSMEVQNNMRAREFEELHTIKASPEYKKNQLAIQEAK